MTDKKIDKILDEDIMDLTDIKSPFDEETDEINSEDNGKVAEGTLERLREIETRFRSHRITVQILEQKYKDAVAKATDDYKWAIDKALLGIRNDFKERNLTTKELREAYAKAHSLDELASLHQIAGNTEELDKAKIDLSRIESEYNHLIRTERRERIELLANLLGKDNEAIFSLTELIK